MNRHLSSEEISRWMAGEPSAGHERHARECPRCTGEIERLERIFLLFRESGQRWADHCYAFTDARPVGGHTSRRIAWPAFAVSLAALALIAILLLGTPAPHRRAEQPFVRVPDAAPPAPYERTELRRMQLPVATLLAAGLEVHMPAMEGIVSADVLLGQDGRALAIRLISDCFSNRDRRLNP